jgi:flavin reductase (DIM6/NTAB) family NADH-FMN oxidoreductase RutF
MDFVLSHNNMDLSWNDRRTRQFVTNVGLITSVGPLGPNIMAAEWTHHISYSPSLIAANIRGHDATAQNIKESKEFGVNIAAENQNVICSMTGKYKGIHVDKISVLKEVGIAAFYNAKRISKEVPMLVGAAMNAECKLVKQEELGDHIMFVGEVIEISADENIRPLLYHNGRYWRLGEALIKPQPDILIRIEELAQKHSRIK